MRTAPMVVARAVLALPIVSIRRGVPGLRAVRDIFRDDAAVRGVVRRIVGDSRGRNREQQSRA